MGRTQCGSPPGIASQFLRETRPTRAPDAPGAKPEQANHQQRDDHGEPAPHRVLHGHNRPG